MRIPILIKYIAVAGILFLPMVSAVAEEKADTIENTESNFFKRSIGAVKDFFRGGKRGEAKAEKSGKEKKASPVVVKADRKPVVKTVSAQQIVKVETVKTPAPEKKKKEEYKDYSVEELYDLSISDNLKIPRLGSQKSNIRSYQLVEAKKLVAAGQQSVEMMRSGEIIIVTLDTNDLFYPNETTLKPNAGKYLNPFVKYLQLPDFYRMILAVHSDNTGSQSYTDELTNKRAMSVMEWFSDHAACSDYVIPYGIGAAEPLVLNNSMENRAKNRRLEIFLVPGKRMISDSSKGLLKH